MRGRVRDAENEVDRVGALVTAAERVGDRVDAASDLAYRTVHQPGGEGARGRHRHEAAPSSGCKGDEPEKPAKRDKRRAS